jgi:adenylate cyclase
MTKTVLVPSVGHELAAIDVNDILNWLIDQGLLAKPIVPMIDGLRDRVDAAGIPVWRLNISTTTLHPQFAAFTVTCKRGEPADHVQHAHIQPGTEQPFLSSPLNEVLSDAAATVAAMSEEERAVSSQHFTRRFVLEQGDGLDRYEILRDFRAQGVTEYFVTATPFGWGEMPEIIENGMLASWATDQPGGFTDSQIDALTAISRALALAVRASSLMDIGETVLRTYLGADAGSRVLRGDIKRGESQAISAAILISDLRGFTTLSDEVPREALVAMLDQYLERMSDPVEDNGGQVLKYLGDGLLATFTCPEDNPNLGCEAAIAAARDMQARTEQLNRERAADGLPTMALDVALHRGEVLYGNVGSDRRLEFTVIGPAVNETARMEAMCGSLNHPIVVSKNFAEASDTPEKFVSLGCHTLRGVREPQELFTLAQPATKSA